MALQAYIDDSVQAGRFLVLAGYVASVEQWLAFSDEWKEALQQARWSKFKMSEAKRDPVIAGYFYRIIETHLDTIFAVGVDIDGLKRAARELGMPIAFENPYSLVYPMMYEFTLNYRHKIGIAEPVDFIFDKHGSRREVEQGFRYMTSLAGENGDQHGKPPRFEDDEYFLPLQAADLLAWHVRAQWVRHGTIVSRPLEMSWKSLKSMEGLIAELAYGEIKENFERLIQFRRPGVPIISVQFTGLDGRKI